MAATTTTTMAAPTDETWKTAQNYRNAIHKEIDQISNGGPGAHETARFEKVEKLMEKYRLACVGIIWVDLRDATQKGVESTLWHTHSYVTKTYKKVIARLQTSDQVVLKRKIEKMYLAFLKTTQYFYKGYLQRICARYKMNILKRIARRAELEEMPVPDQDKVDAGAAQLEELVLASCHKTLVYLGDLARYRTLLRTKDRHWENALTYYALANELMPESGYAHHQCGVIYLEIENHLEVVYHWYRSLACEKPHPLASSNLEHEFRSLRQKKTGGFKDGNQAMLSWFVKLHAFYFKGEEFTERNELEVEVLHRLSMALKSASTQPDVHDSLLKMLLINICAYHVGLAQIQAKWTDARSRLCQFSLLLNIRTILAIATLLRDELVEAQRKTAEATAENIVPATQQEKGSGKLTPAVHHILPLLRVYMAWLCFYKSDIIGYQAYLEPFFGDMCKALSHALSLLFELLECDPAFKTTVSTRFPEDEETVGLKCLNGPGLKDGCQLHYDPMTRKPKPRADEVSGVDFTADDMAFTRALDVVYCGLDLAEDSKFPFKVSETTKGAKRLTAILYLENGKPEQASHPPTTLASSLPSADLFGAAPGVQKSTPEQATNNAPKGMSLMDDDSDEFSDDNEFLGAHAENNVGATAKPLPAGGAAGTPRMASSTSEFNKGELLKLLDGFLAPPELANPTRPLVPQPNSPSQGETSYGMGSTTAREVFAAAAPTSPALGSATAKAFPSLPWNYFYTPTAMENGHPSPAAVQAQSPWKADSPSSSRPVSTGNAMQLQGNEDMSGLFMTGSGAQMQNRYGSPAQQPRAASHAFSSALWGTPATAGQWPQAAQQPQQAAVNRRSSTNSSFSSLAFSASNSSLPQVNSPWGVPMNQQVNMAQALAFSSAAAQSSSSALGTFPGSTADAGLIYGSGNQSAAAGVYAAEEYNQQALLNALVSDYRPKRTVTPAAATSGDALTEALQNQLLSLQAAGTARSPTLGNAMQQNPLMQNPAAWPRHIRNRPSR
ncbi:protein SMG7 [Diplogelasinospora grovesii]|uniref:Nonsense-mediated mRNA decay factor n=1 Tax=Diplogelasinospora grovesii TaxID=303347 RepID=A0AAN6N7C9_9PEZI|nr:protein SMG7 [Diplogelasinospora grovesii]